MSTQINICFWNKTFNIFCRASLWMTFFVSNYWSFHNTIPKCSVHMIRMSVKKKIKIRMEETCKIIKFPFPTTPPPSEYAPVCSLLRKSQFCSCNSIWISIPPSSLQLWQSNSNRIFYPHFNVFYEIYFSFLSSEESDSLSVGEIAFLATN